MKKTTVLFSLFSPPPHPQLVARWDYNPPPPIHRWVKWDAHEGEEGGALLLMTSAGKLRLSRKPDFKGANEKREKHTGGCKAWEQRAGRGRLREQNIKTSSEAGCPQTLSRKHLGARVHLQRAHGTLSKLSFSPFEACRTLHVMYN